MNRPRVTVHMIATADGRITLGAGRPAEEEDFATLYKPGALRIFRTVQDKLIRPDVLLVGSNTILLIDPEKHRVSLPPAQGDIPQLYDDHMPQEIVGRKDRKGWFAVVDSRGQIRWDKKSDAGMYFLALVARGTPAEYLAFLRREGIPYLVVGEQRVDLSEALLRMRTKLGAERVVAGGGGTLNGILLRAGLVDEVSLVVMPALVGGEETPTTFDAPELKPGEMPTRLRLLSQEVGADGNVWLHYEVLRDGGASGRASL